MCYGVYGWLIAWREMGQWVCRPAVCSIRA